METPQNVGMSDLNAESSSLPVDHLSLQSKKNIVLVSHGRPPWYGPDGERISDAFVIGVAGGSASGKTHVARQIVKSLGFIPAIAILSQDSFYKKHTEEELALAHASLYDFDHPSAIDMPMFATCLEDLKACRQSNIPVYSFSEHQRLDETKYLYGPTVIIAEGIMALHDPALRSLYDLKIFVQCDSDLMLARRIERDVKERGRHVTGILEQYLRYVKPAYDNFVRPTAAFADIIVPGSNNDVAIELICTHVRRQLQERSNAFRRKLAVPHLYNSSLSRPPPPPQDGDLKLEILPPTPQVQGILTLLRSTDTPRQDLIFFFDRLATLLVENAMQFLPYCPHTVTTPVGVKTVGQKLNTKHICGVCIQRSGCVLERGFKRVLNNVPMGSLLIQSNSSDGEPLLLQVKIPVVLRKRTSAEDSWVFLLDAQIGTGAAAFMAIRVLLDHGVKQDHIIFVTYLVARRGGIAVLRRAFPHVHIICAAVDNEMKEGWLEGARGEGNPEGSGRRVWLMEPGMGQVSAMSFL
ncbi:armadillo/beta-catenin/plakoglobin [Dendrothele bispora CBS 962.96]|uniref:uridine/cytidine kinase n=1 Tax=Dendrothele bispora (strain CBS 962.96) TaxID=1314807 RepID=A0A4V4HIQ0_DENBC|nr:armadillo/beta-catenin/plakoglobin [Dendrothele bispora CBS 962.96]